MTGHKEYEQMISCLLDGELGPNETRQVEEHLKACPTCRQYKNEIENLSSLLHTWSEDDLSPDLEQKIHNHYNQIKSKDKLRLKTRHPLQHLMVSGSIFIFLLVGYLSLQVYQRTSPYETLAGLKASQTRSDTMPAPEKPADLPASNLTLADSALIGGEGEKRVFEKNWAMLPGSDPQPIVTPQPIRVPQPIEEVARKPIVLQSTIQEIAQQPAAEVVAKADLSGYQVMPSVATSPTRISGFKTAPTTRAIALDKDQAVLKTYRSIREPLLHDNRERAFAAKSVDMIKQKAADDESTAVMGNISSLDAFKVASLEGDKGGRLKAESQTAGYSMPELGEANTYDAKDISGTLAPQPKVYEIYPEKEAEEIMYYPGEPYEDGGLETEAYDRIYENDFLAVKDNPLSTFSIDVDTASYSNIRRFLKNNRMPPPDAVRIEEMINYFTYNYAYPLDNKPFSITTELSDCPWNRQHQLLLIGLQGKILSPENIPPSNIVFLIDVSGSMNQSMKLPLLKKAFQMFVDQLSDQEKIGIVVYAGAARRILDTTPGSNKYEILQAIDRLQAGGSTAGGAGIQLAYQLAQDHFIPNGNNRVILATDGDFNIGSSSDAAMVRMIEQYRDQGIYLTVLGFGTGNYKDSKMKKIADHGNGNYYYIDSVQEAEKVLIQELGSTLFAIAKDVKIQIEFNPTRVKAYRLIGYEDRLLTKEDFNNDRKDAGEIGAGHSVTALYELMPPGSREALPMVDELRYQSRDIIESSDLLTVKLRFKYPDENTSHVLQHQVMTADYSLQPSNNFRFASAVAEFGLLLRDSPYKAQSNYAQVIQRARETSENDPFGYRHEFIDLVQRAQRLDSVQQPVLEDYYFKGDLE